MRSYIYLLLSFLLLSLTANATSNKHKHNFAYPVEDTIRPSLRLKVNTSFIMHQVGVPFHDSLYVEVTDNYWNNLLPVRTGTINRDIPGLYSLIYTAIDGSGNEAIPLSVTIDVRDTIKPIATLGGLDSMELEVFEIFNDPYVLATDNYYPVVTITVTSNLNTGMLGEYKITYLVCDGANNCVTLTRTVRVVDKTAPVIKLVGDNPFVISGYSTYIEPGFWVLDNYYDHSSFKVNVDTSQIIHSQPGVYAVSYNTTDGSGNAAQEVKRLVIVEPRVGVDEVIQSNGIFIYPNPAEHGLVHITDDRSIINRIELIDLLGKTIYSENVINKKEHQLSIENLKPGIYYMAIATTNGKHLVQKIAIQ